MYSLVIYERYSKTTIDRSLFHLLSYQNITASASKKRRQSLQTEECRQGLLLNLRPTIKIIRKPNYHSAELKIYIFCHILDMNKTNLSYYIPNSSSNFSGDFIRISMQTNKHIIKKCIFLRHFGSARPQNLATKQWTYIANFIKLTN